MKKLYFSAVMLITSALSFGQLLNEFEPNPNGTDPAMVSFEISGTPSTAFSGWILSIESDSSGTGTVDRATEVSGNFDANGLLVVMVPDLENPSFTVVLCENFTGTAGSTDLDTDDDGVADDTSTITNVYDAIGIPDATGDEMLVYGAQLGGADFTYTGDEPRIVFRDGMSGDWFAVNDANGDATDQVFDIDANLVANADFDVNPALGTTYGSVNPIYSAPTDPTVTITSPSDGATFAPGTTSVDVAFTVLNQPGSATINVTVNGSTDMDVMDNPYAVATMDSQSYTVTIEMVDGGVLASDEITFSVSGLEQVATIAELRAGTLGNTYELTGEALITYLTSFRNQKHIEDATAAILIDDNSGVITSPYVLADGITGLRGTLAAFNGLLQFVPVEDPGAPSSSGNTLTPQIVTFADLNANTVNYESELVTVEGITFDTMETNFANGLELPMLQSGNMFNFRTAFNEDYSTGNIPAVATDVTGVILNRNNGDFFLMARYSTDFSEDVLSVNQFEQNTFSIYPNPAKTNAVTISTSNSGAFKVAVYDILGKQVKNETVSNNTLDVSELNAGMYILKLTQNDTTVTRKLIIE